MIALVAAMPMLSAAAAPPVAREYDVKATFLFNFTQFVTWPPGAFANTNAPFVIGILGADPFGGFLDELVKNELVDGRRIEVRRYSSVEQANAAQILFIGKSEHGRIDSILEALKANPILTVSETDERRPPWRGGIIAFVTVRDKVRLRINLDAARAANLTISTKLLRLAEVQQSPPP